MAKPRNRTLTIPVIVPDKTRGAFFAALRDALHLNRTMANFALAEIMICDQDWSDKLDSTRDGLSLEKRVANRCEVTTTQSSAVCRMVISKYRQKRWQIHRGEAVPQYRSVPWFLKHNRSTRGVRFSVDDAGIVHAKIKLVRDWWDVSLTCRKGHERSLRVIKDAIKQQAETDEFVLRDSRIRLDRKNNVVMDVAVALPNVPASKHTRRMDVQTMRESLFVAAIENSRQPFTITGDKVRKWQKERERRQERLRKDSKAGTANARLKKQRRQASAKYQNRLSSFCHESSAQIVAHAVRNRVGVIVLDMTVKSFLPSFTYFDFKTKLAYKCENHGIEFRDATQGIVEPNVDRPHVYFAYSKADHKIKIGKTTRDDLQRIKEGHTWCPDAVYAAIECVPKSKLNTCERLRQNQFDEFQLYKNQRGQEWFAADPVLTWLREVQWLGNAGNLAELRQVLDAKWFQDPPSSRASVRLPNQSDGNSEVSQERFEGSAS